MGVLTWKIRDTAWRLSASANPFEALNVIDCDGPARRSLLLTPIAVLAGPDHGVARTAVQSNFALDTG
jgi:hypothetical protein